MAPETTTVVEYSPPPATNPLCGCDRGAMGVMIFVALAVGIVIGLALAGFDKRGLR